MYSRIEKSLVSGPSSCIDAALKSVKTALVCLAVLLVFASAGLSDVIIGNFESADSNDSWIPGSGDADAVLIPASAGGVTLDSGSLKLIPSASGNFWELEWEGNPIDLAYAALQFDVTMLCSEWSQNVWTKIADKIAINSDGPSGWKEYNNLATATDRDTGDPVGLDWGRWWAEAPDMKKTFSLDVSDYDATGATYMQIHISVQGRDANAGYYFDNMRVLTPDMIIRKCNVTAGKTQYHGDEDFNDMKDSFTASGTLMLPNDCNDINEVIATLTNDQDEVVCTETLNDFNASIVNRTGKYTHTAKLIKGQPGCITSLVLDFRKGTFAVAAKNINLTGLTAPFEVKFEIGSFEQKGTVNENVINGASKTIPTRFMRLYDDKLVTTKAVVSHKTTPLTDILNLRGEIAVADMNFDSDEPNLANEAVTLAWGDINDANSRTFVIPAGSFKAAKKGHVYKCSKVEADANDGNAGFIAGTIDLDACTYQFAINKAEDIYAQRLTQGQLSISFDTEQGTFDEEDHYSIP